jgi:hypothetical protein
VVLLFVVLIFVLLIFVVLLSFFSEFIRRIQFVWAKWKDSGFNHKRSVFDSRMGYFFYFLFSTEFFHSEFCDSQKAAAV